MEEINCDMAHILQSRDFSVLQKLVAYFQNIRAKKAAKAEEANALKIECSKNRAMRVKKISELKQEIEYLKSEIDNAELQQKIMYKKISNAVKQEEKLKEEVEQVKLERENLFLEMVDLQQEAEKKKCIKLKTWNAIKRACHIYKQHLDIRIQLIENKDCEQISVSFFVTDVEANNKYYTYLSNLNSRWRVDCIEPMVKPEDCNDFKGIVDFANKSEIADVTAFLCRLRNIFMKYYLDTK